MPKEQTIKKRKLIQRIRNFWKEWPEHLDEMLDKKDLENMREPQLESLFEEVKQVVGSSSETSVGDFAPQFIMAAYEKLACSMGLYVKGIHGIGNDPNFKKAFKEMMLEFDMMAYIPPWARVALMVSQSTAMQHFGNEERMAKDGKNLPNSPSNPVGARLDETAEMMKMAELQKSKTS